MPFTPGRKQGAKNRLSWSFLSALADDFAEHGEGVIKICKIEKPHEYLKIVAGLMPKEFEFTDNRLTELGDEELDAIIEYAKHRLEHKRTNIIDITAGEGETLNGEPAPVLQALPKAS
jgi:hypothetical protein